MTDELELRRERHYGDRVVRCYTRRPAGIDGMLREAVGRYPSNEAIVCGETRLTYAQFEVEVSRVAAGLARRGVRKGDRVALLLGNGVPFVVLVYAVARLGAVSVPMSIRDQMPGIRHAIVNSGAVLLVAESGLAGIVPPPEDTPGLLARISVGTAEGFLPYETLRQDGSVTADPEVGEEDVATILYTSGTTGVPKGAMLTGLGIVHSSANFVQAMKLTPDDRTVVVVPMNHVTGLVAGIHTAIRTGAAIIVMREFKAIPFLECAQRERMTFSLMVPAMYNLCLHKADLVDYDLGCWRIGGYGGAPMPAATIERLSKALPNLGLMNAYGATETTSPATVMPADQTASRRLSVGVPVPGAEICIMDDDGLEVPRGENGEIWIHGAMVVPGYWQNEAANSREFVAGFWKSGDIGSIDEDGYVFVHDRKKDMINRGGLKIYTAQVESVLASFPGVLEAAVIAAPCPILGERVHAVLSIQSGSADESALKEHCALQLADYQCPESYTFREQPLPRNANGKIQKRRIREELGLTQ